jgi:hypothetical protein
MDVAIAGMARKLRLEFPGAVYHVINRGNYRNWIFRDERTRAAFESCLFEACGKTGWLLHAFGILAENSDACAHPVACGGPFARRPSCVDSQPDTLPPPTPIHGSDVEAINIRFRSLTLFDLRGSSRRANPTGTRMRPGGSREAAKTRRAAGAGLQQQLTRSLEKRVEVNAPLLANRPSHVLPSAEPIGTGNATLDKIFSHRLGPKSFHAARTCCFFIAMAGIK